MNVRDLVDFNPAQWSYVGPVFNFIDEGYAVDADPSKRGLLASRIAPVFGLIKSTAIASILVGKLEGQLGVVSAVAHIGLAVLSLYEGASWAEVTKEGLTACITLSVADHTTILFAFAGMCAGGASLFIPAIGRFDRSVKSGLLSLAERQINILEGTDKPDARRWTLQPKGDLIAEGVAAALVNTTMAIWKDPFVVATAPCNLIVGTVSTVAGTVSTAASSSVSAVVGTVSVIASSPVSAVVGTVSAIASLSVRVFKAIAT